MTIDELLRRIVRGHWLTIAVCLVLPVALTVLLASRVQPRYVATVRLQVSAVAPASAFEADALGSRVIALATTPQLVRAALSEAGLDPAMAPSVARDDVSSRRLGQSTVVELSVSRASREDARATVIALAGQVARFMNDGNRAQFDRALASIDRELGKARDALATATRRLGSHDPALRPDLKAEVDAAQATVDQLATTRSEMTLADSSRDQVVLIDADQPDVRTAPTSLLPRAALAVILGLLLGVAVAVVIETLRPRLAGVRSLARRFEAPVLGQAGQRPAALINAMSMAARRQGRNTVVLLGIDDRDDDIAHRLLAKVARPGRSTVPMTLVGRSNSPRAGSSAAEEAVAAAAVQQVRFTDLTGVGPVDERAAGVVLVSSDAPRQRDVETVEDILRTTRWPVLGVVGTKHADRSAEQ